MNNKEGNKKGTGARPNSARPSSNKPKPAMAKRAQGPKKAKPNTKIDPKAIVKVEKKPNQAPKRPKVADEIRLNKYISNSGACSRRDADIYIQSGNVKVNGIPVVEMGYMVKPGDVVNFDGATLTPEKKEYILLNKPKNFTTSVDENDLHRNVFELVRGATNANIQSVGRMDKNTTGLLLFTNDTDMIRKFGLPNQKSSKIYQVSLDKNLKYEDLEKISKGITLDGHRLFVEEVSYIENEPKTEIGLKLRTSNVKVVRAIFESFKYDVLRIDRVSFAGLTKKNLPRGNWRFLTEQEVINLKNT
ncbi:pseudouridine synthase [Flavobacterium sp.]|uniref:pseudouridine synthase n=1 Tax=Flavobacterium sp. TaxID=239 RepID=UPI00286AEB5A|nr:pseudouridine synthase [Flavobacterium sp.]